MSDDRVEALVRRLHETVCPETCPRCSHLDIVRTAIRAGIDHHRQDCASRGCMWCREQLKEKP